MGAHDGVDIMVHGRGQALHCASGMVEMNGSDGMPAVHSHGATRAAKFLFFCFRKRAREAEVVCSCFGRRSVCVRECEPET